MCLCICGCSCVSVSACGCVYVCICVSVFVFVVVCQSTCVSVSVLLWVGLGQMGPSVVHAVSRTGDFLGFSPAETSFNFFSSLLVSRWGVCMAWRCCGLCHCSVSVVGLSYVARSSSTWQGDPDLSSTNSQPTSTSAHRVVGWEDRGG